MEGKQAITNSNTKKAEVSVKIDGLLFIFPLGYNEESILQAALDKGADLPYSCRNGVCTTCKARLLEGSVEMDNNWGLDDEEIDKGFVLTCQSHPTTAKVFIDFDDR